MLATMSLSPMVDAFSGVFIPSPGEHKELPGDNLENLIQQHHLAECSMCGDVGLQGELFKCIKCQIRNQHTYCCRSYPSRRSFSGICDWCDMGEGSGFFAHGKPCSTICESECTEVFTWRNDIEMLLAAAEVSRKPAVDVESVPASGYSKRISWSGPKRLRRPARTKPALGSSSIFKCKHSKLDQTNFSKRVGRRYKCILDVY